MYDIIFVVNTPYSYNAFKKFKKKYPLAKSAETYSDAIKKVFTKAFWVVWPNLNVNDDFKFDYEIEKWDEEYVHVFQNDENHNGVCLIPKTAKVSDREFNHRFFVHKKELDIMASTSVDRYDIFSVDTYEEYLAALELTSTELFWIISKELCIVDTFKFDLFFTTETDEYIFDRERNHAFIHTEGKNETYNGVLLCSTYSPLSKKEIDFRFPVNRKEWSITASISKPYDIVFISYNEPNADINYQKLLERFPLAKRVDKVKGIHQAHITAATLSSTRMFWVVDGDAQILDSFNFDFVPLIYDRDCVHVWRSQNPINGLKYGYGGVKLLPTQSTISMDVNSPDMTTAISSKFKVIDQIANITAFNTDPFNTWKSAFRECVKLASKTIRGQLDTETEARLDTWCNIADGKFAIYALHGARAGRIYGEENADNLPALSKINDFEWLEQHFKLTSVLR